MTLHRWGRRYTNNLEDWGSSSIPGGCACHGTDGSFGSYGLEGLLLLGSWFGARPKRRRQRRDS